MKIVMTVLRDCYTDELEALTSPTTGIAAQCNWPPTLYDFAQFRRAYNDKLVNDENFRQRYPRRDLKFFPTKREPFRPFPKLWAAFESEPDIVELLDHPPSFEYLDQAGRIHATQGKDEARAYIDRKWSIGALGKEYMTPTLAAILAKREPKPGTAEHFEWQEQMEKTLTDEPWV